MRRGNRFGFNIHSYNGVQIIAAIAIIAFITYIIVKQIKDSKSGLTKVEIDASIASMQAKINENLVLINDPYVPSSYKDTLIQTNKYMNDNIAKLKNTVPSDQIPPIPKKKGFLGLGR